MCFPILKWKGWIWRNNLVDLIILKNFRSSLLDPEEDLRAICKTHDIEFWEDKE